SLAAQAAVSIENSKTFERIRARDRLVALGEMAGGLAHEIRNPLATIRTALALLETPGDEDPQELREMVVEEVHRLNRTVGLFLDYARPSPSHLAPWDVVKTLERAVEGAKPEGSGCARVDLQVEPELPRMPLDGEKLERVISNLVRNALEACGPAGSVRVLAETDRADDGTLRGLQVLVEDDGCGMDAETLERAFVPFFTTRERGVGLGLALCERLVRAEGGQIDIRSEAGSGTRARVWLPLPESRVEETRDG
ncbi:MAG: ATP-binding protein, partial [Myxococcota bacterium]